MMMKHIFLITLIVALLSLPAFAQDNMSLTIEKSIEIGLANSKFLHASLMKSEGAEAKFSEANASRLPTIKFGGSVTRLSEVPPFQIGPFPPLIPEAMTISSTVLDNYNLRLSLQHPIVELHVHNNAVLASYNAQAAEKDYTRDKSDLVYNIKTAYWTLYKANEFKKVIDEVVEQMKSHLKDVQNFMDQGIATKNDVLRVETQLSSAQLTQLDAGNNVQLAMIGLNNIIGIPLGTKIEIASRIQDAQNTSYDINSLMQKANEHRADLQAMELRVKAGEAGVGLAKAGWFPQIFLVGNYYYSRPNARIFPTIDAFKNTWDIGVNVSLDIWNWGTTIHQTHQAQAQLAQAKDALDQLKDGVSLEVTQSFLNYNESRDRIGVAQKGVEQAEENYRITNEKYKSGLVLNSDVLDAEVSLLQSKWNYIQALVDHELADAKLLKATATDLNN
jgi:outer membrane protein TolC